MLVQAVFRHGARSPLTDRQYLWKGHVWDVCGSIDSQIELDVRDLAGGPRPPCRSDQKQINTKLEGGCSKGELTLEGQKQAIELGRWLRQRYMKDLSFLPEVFQEGAVVARTTNFSRTVGTLRGVLTGMYPDHQGPPVRVATSAEIDEILYADTATCPHLNGYMAAARALLAEEEAQDVSRAALNARLAAALELPEGHFDSAWKYTDIHDVLTSLAAHDKALPPAMTAELRAEVQRLATREFAAHMAPSVSSQGGPVVLRLSLGRLIDRLLANLAAAAEAVSADVAADMAADVDPPGGSGRGGVSSPLLYLYSGHDSTIMPLLAALGAEIDHWPPYLSNIIFELWECPPGPGDGPPGLGHVSATSRHVVRVLYNREELSLPDALPDGSVDLADFQHQVLAPFVLSESDHRLACVATPSHDDAMPIPQMAGGTSETADTDA